MNKGGLLKFLIVSIIVLLPFTLAFSGSGEGIESSPYNITNCTQLQEVNDNLAAYYQLINNINCSDTINWNAGVGFIPLGDGLTPFSGNFQGNNYNISGLYINNNTRDYAGLFGDVFGEVKNVRLIQADITAGNYVGGIAGLYEGPSNLSNVHTSGQITGDGDVGGLVGDIYQDISILNSSSSADIISTNDYTGGLVGYAPSGVIIENSFFTGSVFSTRSYTGGIAGIFSGPIISNCYSSGNVTSSGTYTGGLVGRFDGETGTVVSNSNTSGNITGKGYTGGLVGLFEKGDIINSHATGEINGTGYVGGLFGSFGEGDILNSYASGNVDGNNDCVGGLAGEFIIGQIIGSNASGNVNSSEGWYVGGLVGEFYEEWGEGYAYLISNSHATGNVIGYSQVGGLVGDFYTGNISDSYATGNISGSVEVGGLVGYFMGLTISNSSATGRVDGTDDSVGGLVGRFDSGMFISDCYASGDVTGEGMYTGGLVGKFEGNVLEGTDEEIRNSYATGNVNSLGDYTGGLVGIFSGDTITSRLITSYATGNVTSTGNYAGGLVGLLYGAINNTYATGKVIGEGVDGGVGGLVGSFNGRILSDSYSSGDVEGIINTGGFAGIISSGGESTLVKNSYSTGRVNESATNVGGFAGRLISEAKIDNVYWYNWSTTLDCYSGGNENCTAISEEEYFFDYENAPMNLSSSTGWNFSETWDEVYNGKDYPVLLWQGITIPDVTALTYSYATENLNTTIAGQVVLFSVLWDDDTALNPTGQYIFSTNNTGTWVNDSAINFTTTPEWANITKTLNSTAGILIGYKWYAKDDAGNWNETGMNTLTTEEAEEEEEDEEENGDTVSYSSPKINPVDTSQPNQDIELRIGDKIEVADESNNYVLRLDKFNSSEARLKLDNSTNNTPSYKMIILPIGEEYHLDLNLDSKFDLVLIYQGISNLTRRAIISTRAVNVILEDDPIVEEQEKPNQKNSDRISHILFWIILIILFIISMIVFFASNKKKKPRIEDKIKVRIKKK